MGKNTHTFAYTNTHPLGADHISDCAYRAVSIATGKDWLTVYDELTALGRELLTPPNDDHTIGVYMDGIADKIRVAGIGSKPTAKTVTRLDPSKTYVVKVASHLVAIKGGKIRDTWDCSNRVIKTVWQIRE